MLASLPLDIRQQLCSHSCRMSRGAITSQSSNPSVEIGGRFPGNSSKNCRKTNPRQNHGPLYINKINSLSRLSHFSRFPFSTMRSPGIHLPVTRDVESVVAQSHNLCVVNGLTANAFPLRWNFMDVNLFRSHRFSPVRQPLHFHFNLVFKFLRRTRRTRNLSGRIGNF